jgi:hypothetical protein
MEKKLPRLTARLIQTICKYVQSGAFEQTACEAVGLPFTLYQDWLARGEQAKAGRLLRLLVRELEQARALARLRLEVRMRADDPRLWLLHGPGREARDRQGWSAPARAPDPESAGGEGFAPEVWDFVCAIHAALKPFPEARQPLVPIAGRFFAAQTLPE